MSEEKKEKQEITGTRPCDGLRVDLKRCMLLVGQNLDLYFYIESSVFMSNILIFIERVHWKVHSHMIAFISLLDIVEFILKCCWNLLLTKQGYICIH